MSSRSSHVRTKIVALLVSLVALWAFAAFVTIREGVNLLAVSTLNDNVAQPGVTLLEALQDERRTTQIYLGGNRPLQRTAMLEARARTDAAVTTFRELAGSRKVKFSSSNALTARIGDTFAYLDELATTDRGNIDAGRLTRPGASRAYTDIVDSIFHVYDSLAAVDDQGIAKDARTLIQIVRGRELLSQEDALVSGALAGPGLNDAEQLQFVELIGAQQFVFAEAAAALPPADRARYDTVVNGIAFIQLHTLEQTVQTRQLVPLEQWSAAVPPELEGYSQIYVLGGADLVGRATPVGGRRGGAARPGRRPRSDRRHRVHHHLHHHRAAPGPPARTAAQRGQRAGDLPAAPGGGTAAARRAGRRERRGPTLGLRPGRDRPGE